MAQSVYKVNTAAGGFAYLSQDQTRTVISASGLEGGKENLPGIAYCHNVIPTERGIQSISYEPLVPAISSITGRVTDVRIVYSIQRTREYIAFTDDGASYRLVLRLFGGNSWVLIEAAPVPGDNSYNKDLLSLGRVNGVTYLYYPQLIAEPASGNAVATYYDSDLNAYVEVELIGTEWDTVIGISATNGYLVAYTQLAMAWSSTLNPLDFVPSQVTGAGGGDVAMLAGNIKFCIPNSLGLIFYTEANAVACTYTGNTQYPFKFREVAGSKGGLNLDRIAYEANSDPQFVFTKGGIQSITSREAKAILPDLTDFLTGRHIETLNTVTWEYEEEILDAYVVMAKKVKYIASRYLLFSYGTYSIFTETGPTFTHSILWDTALSKPGKFLFDHTDVFEFTDSAIEGSKDSIAFIKADGSTYLVNAASDFRSEELDDAGVVVFGKMQGTRTRKMTMLGVEFESLTEGQAGVECIDLASLTGARDFAIVHGVQSTDSPAEAYRNYSFRSTAENHNVGILGRFSIDTFIVSYTVNGRR
jgi:hypothetical protein